MSIKRFTYQLFIFLGIQSISYAQDIHFSQFMHNPLALNPANTGDFNADYRFNFAFRDQWRAVTIPYTTFFLSADRAKIYKNLSIGLTFMHDVVGDGRFRTIDFQPSAALDFFLDSEKKHCIRPGIQLGLNFRELRSDQFKWDSQFGGHVYDPSLPSNENFQRESLANFTLNSGAVYSWNDGDRRNLNFGISVFNLNKQNQGFFGEDIPRSRRITIHGRGQFAIHEKLDLLPAFMWNAQHVYREFLFGSEVRYILNEKRGQNIALYSGVFTRFKDAAFLNFGMDYQNWFFGVSYDMNYSNLAVASRVRGGIEFTVQYILKSVKPKNTLHRICPVYI